MCVHIQVCVCTYSSVYYFGRLGSIALAGWANEGLVGVSAEPVL